MSRDIIKNLKKEGFYSGRMVGESKTMYKNVYPYNMVFFDANIYIFNGEKFENIWFGDIDIHVDAYILKEISFNNNTIFYILPKSNTNFEDESMDVIIENSVWNSTLDVPIITEEYINNIELELSKKREEAKELEKQYFNDMLTKNETLKIKKPKKIVQSKIIKKIKIDNKLIKKALKKYRKKIKFKLKTLKGDELHEYKNKLKRKDCFSYLYLRDYLSEKLNLKKSDLSWTSYWTINSTIWNLGDLDFEIESLFQKDYKRENIHPFGLQEITLQKANEANINIESFKEDYIYIIEK